MIIEATIRVEFNQGYAYDSLELIIKFKEPGKRLRTKIERPVLHNYYIDNSEFIENVEKFLEDENNIKESAADMIKDYFETKNKKDKKEQCVSAIITRTNAIGKVKIKVDIK